MNPDIVPYNDKSKDLISLGEHALFGLSLSNSYYGVENIKKLYDYGLKNFRKFDFIIIDKPSTHNLRACSYDESKIKKRVKHDVARLSNRCIRAAQSFGLDEIQAKNKLKLWSQFEGTKPFDEILSRTKELFENNAHFREKLLAHVEDVTSNIKVVGVDSLMMNPKIAVNYFLEELPFHTHCPEIFDVSSSVWFYHKYHHLMEDFMNGLFGIPIHSLQGAAIINFPNQV